MKKNSRFIPPFMMLIIFLIFNSNFIIGQNVSIDIYTVNGFGFSNPPITLLTSGVNSISLSSTVTLPSIPSDSNPGTIKVFYQINNGTNPIVASGGNGGSLLFLGSNSSTRSFNISLNSNDFNNSGGFIFVEYQTFSGLKHKSNNIPIIKPTPSQPNPGTGTGSSTSLTLNVPFGGIPLLPTTGSGDIWTKKTYTNQIGELITRAFPIERFYETVVIERILYNPNLNTYSRPSNPFTLRINVERPFPQITNLRIIDNVINSDQYVHVNQQPSTIIGENATILGVPNNQIHYQWQKRIYNPYELYYSNSSQYQIMYNTFGWTDIPGATSKDYTPQIEDNHMQYRRLIVENPSAPASFGHRRSASSNVVGVYRVGFNIPKNIINICCNQSLTWSMPINEITSNLFPSGLGLIYFWQEGIVNPYTNQVNSWVNVVPPFAYENWFYTPQRKRPRSGELNFERRYRRIHYTYDSDLFVISNEISYFFNYGSASGRLINNTKNLSVYPNPTNGNLNISNLENVESLSYSINDIKGLKVMSDRNLKVTDIQNLMIDVSKLSVGTYIISIEIDGVETSHKFIKI